MLENIGVNVLVFCVKVLDLLDTEVAICRSL